MDTKKIASFLHLPNEKLQPFFSWMIKFFANLGKVTLIIVCLVIGFLTSEAWSVYQKGSKKDAMPKVITMSQVSVAFNERGEMLLINRRDGTYSVYQDSVAMTIFGLCAQKIYKSETDKK
jgi:hypothetical protein